MRFKDQKLAQFVLAFRALATMLCELRVTEQTVAFVEKFVNSGFKLLAVHPQ
jgi:hypothetical protein